MSTASRFNLRRLRALNSLQVQEHEATSSKALALSRREFLRFTGAGAAYAGYSTVPHYLQKDYFSVVRDGSKIHFLVENQLRWTLDPELFDGHAVAHLDRKQDWLRLSLRDALFPGTQLPASFECIVQKSDAAWVLAMTMECGLAAEAEFVPWLLGRTPADGRWDVKTISPFDGFALNLEGPMHAEYRPDWSFHMRGGIDATVRGLKSRLHSSQWRLALNEGEPIAAGQLRNRTTFTLLRQQLNWDIDLNRVSETGWRILHEPNLFRVCTIEGASTPKGPVRTALLSQFDECPEVPELPGRAGNEAVLNFQPGGALCTECGEPFSMPLSNARLAFGLEETFHSSLIADLSEQPLWAHDSDVSYLFSKTADAPFFEFHEGPQTLNTPQISPGICEVCFPNDDVCMNLKLGVPRPVPFTWADFLAPFERFLGWLHLVPTRDEHGKLIIDLQKGDSLYIERPRDLLSLQFNFENMRLITGLFPRIVHVRDAGEPRVKVVFPPQNAAEQAFFNAEDSGIAAVEVPIGQVERDDYAIKPSDPNPALADLKKIYDREVGLKTSELDLDTPGIRLSCETRLVFGLPRHRYEIPCEIDSLLKWDEWLPIVAPVAQSVVDTSDPTKLPSIVPPDDVYTSIEIPFRLNLSPSELGRWAHSVKPVESTARVVELWHTRLGVKPNPRKDAGDNAKGTVDETNTKDRVVRAIWSPDFVPVPLNNQSCTMMAPALFPAHYAASDTPSIPSPFRTSLDVRDRCELVHLTSNYGITQQKHFCENQQIIPPKENLLPPAPVQIDQLMLTAMGGYLEAFGQWNPAKVDMNNQLTVQMWKHKATLGRDHYVKVVYKGYLAPFGLRASLVKVTQRYFAKNGANNWVAILHQHMYIVLKNERKQCPIMGQPFGGRAFPFSYVEPVTLTTPFLNDPTKQHWPRDCSIPQSQSLFWPMVPAPTGTPPPPCQGVPPSPPDPPAVIFNFRLRFTDITGIHSVEASMPLVFVGSDVAQTDGFGTAPDFKSQDAVRLYNGGSVPPTPNADDPYISASFNGQKLSFATSAKPGDTDFETGTIAWRAMPLTAAISGSLTNVSPGSTIIFKETMSGLRYVVIADSSGSYHLDIDSGIYVITILTPQPSPAPAIVASSGILAFQGNGQYTLDLKLSADFQTFNPAPSPSISPDPPSPSALDLYRYDLPFFYPAIDYARITSTSIKRITGNTSPTKFNFSSTYLSDGFNAKTNVGEVVLQKNTDDTLTLSFGGQAGNVDKAGGLSSPDTLVVGFSRKAGAVGGTTTMDPATANSTVTTSVSTFSSGKFDPVDFFGGLLSAKLLGAVKLSDIIAPLASGLASNLGKAPLMLEQALYTAETYTLNAAKAIADFQGLTDNPLATHLSTQAQQVAAASNALSSAKSSNSDLITQGVLEGQLVARIADYTNALQVAVQNPLSLVEDAILEALSDALQSAITAIDQTVLDQLNLLASQLSEALDQQIQSLLPAFDALQNALEAKIVDGITAVEQTLAALAPDLNTVIQLRGLVQNLFGNVTSLGASIKTLAVNPLPVQQLAQITANVNNVAVDLQQIYEKAGFLGVVISKATAGTAFSAAITNGQNALKTLWLKIDYSAVAQDLAILQDNCVKLASAYDQTHAEGQQILQNVRQLQNCVAKATTYKKKAASLPDSPEKLYRQLQLLQKMQGHILRALSALQSLASQTLPAGLPAAVQAAAQKAAADIITAVADLADELTVSPQLLNDASTVGTAIELQLAVLTGDPDATKTLHESSADLLQQLKTLRAQIAKDPLNVALKLLHYNLSIDYQRPLAIALSYIAYLQAAANTQLNNFVAILAPVETLALQLQTTLCKVQGLWATFVSKAKTISGPNNARIGTIVVSLFGSDIDAIDAAFTNLCDPNQIAPSQLLHNAQQVSAAFVALVTDIRSKIPSLSTVEAALTDAVKQEVESLLATLLDDIPIPTSVNLSYTWAPEIQSFEPVFILGPDAAFTVTASAQAGLNSQLNGVTGSFVIDAELTSFSIVLIGEDPFITLVIDKLTFTSHNGSKPDVRLTLNTVTFGAAMQFVQDLADLLDPSDGPFIELAADSIRAGFRFAIESMTLGAFNLMQLAIEVAVALPFDGTPVRCELGLSDQQLPFLLSCGIYGGGGFLQLQLGLDGVQLLQGAFEFGVCAAISIGPLQGDGFVVAGI